MARPGRTTLLRIATWTLAGCLAVGVATSPGLDYTGSTVLTNSSGTVVGNRWFFVQYRETTNAQNASVAYTSSQPLAWASGRPIKDIRVALKPTASTASRGCGSPVLVWNTYTFD